MSAGYYADDYEPPHVSIWQRINRLLWVLLILTMVAFIIGSFLPELEKQRTEQEARARLHRLIDEQNTLKSRNKRQIGWLENDPEYLATLIRDKFDLMKEGETILIIDPPKPPALQPEPVAPPSGSSSSQTRKR